MFLDYDFRHFNFRLIFYMIALNVIGILVIRSATNLDADAVNKQLMGVLVGLAVAIGLSLIDYHKILNFSIAIYGVCIASLVAVLIWGKVVNNAKRWIEVPGTLIRLFMFLIYQRRPSLPMHRNGRLSFYDSWYPLSYDNLADQSASSLSSDVFPLS